MDILRSLAIVVVVNCHITSTFANPSIRSIFGLGGKGVDLFFVLSGWLLGNQLLTELRDKGAIEIKRFWLRRWVRTLPAYYALLAGTYFQQVFLTREMNLDPSFLFFGQTYLSNMPYFGVSWSLCVEEHFYLLIAPLLMFLTRRWGAIVLLVLLGMPTLFRQVGWFGNIAETHVRWDQCGFGVLLAYIHVYRPDVWHRMCRVAGPITIVALGLVFQSVLARMNTGLGVTDYGPLVWTAISASLVLIANSNEFWRSEVRFPLTRFIADRSYSLYLVHVEAIFLIKKIPNVGLIPAGVLVWICSIAFAELLHRVVERPFLRARERWSWSREQVHKPARTLGSLSSAAGHSDGSGSKTVGLRVAEGV
jgi:peptidoglycan/LPS O-acetylase OafA/YrhL